MRTLTSASALALTLTLAASSPARADKPLWLDRPDLHAHFWLSYGLALTATEVLEGPDPAWGPGLGTGRALAASTGAVAALGLFKEPVLDDTVGGDDLVADALGLALNAAVQVMIEF
jgi:hypothetical protein